jgi:AcrR family transcriptional regulator
VGVPVSPDSRPLRADAERNRQRLLEAAGALFAEKGLNVGLDEIARHAGVGVGTAYRRFRDKDELIEALFSDRIAAVTSLAERALADPDPWAGFVGFMEGSMRMQVADRGLKEALFRSGHRVKCLEEGRERVAPLVEELLHRAQESGGLRADVEVTDSSRGSPTSPGPSRPRSARATSRSCSTACARRTRAPCPGRR